MAFDPGSPDRARRSAIVGFWMFAAGFVLGGIGGFILRVPAVVETGLESWTSFRDVVLYIPLAIMAAGLVPLGISAHAMAKHKRANEETAAALRSELTAAGEPPVESFPADPRPDNRKYRNGQVVLLFAILLTPDVALLVLFGISRLPGVDASIDPLLWTVLVLAAVTTVGSVVALPLMHRARQNADARWEIAQREAREAAANPK